LKSLTLICRADSTSGLDKVLAQIEGGSILPRIEKLSLFNKYSGPSLSTLDGDYFKFLTKLSPSLKGLSINNFLLTKQVAENLVKSEIHDLVELSLVHCKGSIESS